MGMWMRKCIGVIWISQVLSSQLTPELAGIVHVSACRNTSIFLPGYTGLLPKPGTSIRWSILRPFSVTLILIHTLGESEVTFNEYYQYRIRYLESNGTIVLMDADIADSGIYETILTPPNSNSTKTYFHTVLSVQDVLQPPLIIQDRIESNRLVHLRCVVRIGEVNEILWLENGNPVKDGHIYEVSIDNKTLTINAPHLPSCVLYTCVVRNKVSENRNSHLFLIEELLLLHQFSLVSSAVALVSTSMSYSAEVFILLHALQVYKVHKRHMTLSSAFIYCRTISSICLLVSSLFCTLDPGYPVIYRVIEGIAFLLVLPNISFVLFHFLKPGSQQKRPIVMKKARRNFFLVSGAVAIAVTLVPIYRGLYNVKQCQIPFSHIGGTVASAVVVYVFVVGLMFVIFLKEVTMWNRFQRLSHLTAR